MILACLLSPAVGLFMAQCVGLYIVLWEVITHEAPQGEPDTQQMGSLAVTRSDYSKGELEELKASPTMWQLEYILTGE